MPQIFISWSGDRGKGIGQTLQVGLTGVFADLGQTIDIAFSPERLQVGADWRKQLHEQLLAANLGIIVLEPAALDSSWVAFEAGYIAACTNGNTDRINSKLFPLLLSGSLDVIKRTPFELLQCSDLSIAGIERLLRAVFQAQQLTVAANQISPLAAKLYGLLKKRWDELANDRNAVHQQLFKDIHQLLDAYHMFSLIDDSEAEKFRKLLSASTDARLFDELSQIASLFQQCMRDRARHFGRLAIDWALPNLIEDTRVRLAEIAHGKIPVRNRASVREFWLTAVIGKAQKSIWTTNVARPGASIGNTVDPQFLKKQQQARAHEVSITRLFVYDPDMPKDETDQRRKLMASQIDIDIRVLVITVGDFNQQAIDRDARKKIGSDDFMIVDEEHLYLTFPQEHDIEAVFLDGNQYPNQLRAAKEFRESLELWAIELDKENVKKFPQIAS